MGKAGGLYFGSFIVLIIGLWGIIRVGNRIQPPHSLAGTWVIENSDGFPAESFTLAQSGIFARLSIEGSEPMSLEQEEERIGEDGWRLLRLEGDGQSIEVRWPSDPADGSSEYEFRFQGHLNGTWRAVRQTDDKGPGRSRRDHAST